MVNNEQDSQFLSLIETEEKSDERMVPVPRILSPVHCFTFTAHLWEGQSECLTLTVVFILVANVWC